MNDLKNNQLLSIVNKIIIIICYFCSSIAQRAQPISDEAASLCSVSLLKVCLLFSF